ncbi:MAG: GNAT family N-acetyltransferase [Novosphingobium sp. 28-62-57]|uniref:GNAT family N-acetyltransferase n=1 Tax=unclassified Novosphingobium TaxID=2644732 RepID=UPI000BC51167|nr:MULTISPECIES: GNAT family N-acetyltransferase [unclassified Novosphingobium]OYW50463.1 MAG: GNAT family N-acetyltransferase [Novosphingobium sp. 12-62-10]OYZ11434.1 MAG: GNAT family N-acetyltransferase [Novosphingobium sp. 28-62-57]OZA31537.1 MAG: GNAT family N-acetyltransferase [Novosphingobium sp. 17-62-9]
MMLRLATPADVPALSDLGRRAFVAKFGHLYSAENLARFLDETHAPATISAQLADPEMQIAVIEQDGKITSFCKIARTSTLPPHTPATAPMELKQLYTDPDLIGRGHGAQLMDWALAQARAWGADEMQLSVYADNPEAQRFYRRYGLEKVADITFAVGDHIDPEFLFAGPV